MKKTIPTKLTKINTVKVIEILAETPEKLENLSKRLSVNQLSHPLGSDERTFTEDLAHLINVEARSSEAIYLALLADEPLFVDIHPERQFGKLTRYELLPFEDLLTYFKIRRTILLRVLNSLKEEQWSRSIRESGKQRKESVYWRARTIAMHELDHISDLERKLRK